MKRFMSLFLAIIMILGTTTEVFATQLNENMPKQLVDYRSLGEGSSFDDDFDFGPIMPASITPSSEKRHEYRFYVSEKDAKLAKEGDTSKTPLDVKFVRTGGRLEERELKEKKMNFLKAGSIEKMTKKTKFLLGHRAG